MRVKVENNGANRFRVLARQRRHEIHNARRFTQEAALADCQPSTVLMFITKGVPDCAGLGAGRVFLPNWVWISPNTSKPKSDRLSPIPFSSPRRCSGLNGDSPQFQPT